MLPSPTLIHKYKLISCLRYQARLMCTIDDFLNISVQCAPSIILTKAKFHFFTPYSGIYSKVWATYLVLN